MNFDSFPKPKSNKELQKQVKSAEKILQTKIRPSHESLEGLDISTIQEKYKTRYEAYLLALRASRMGSVQEKPEDKEIRHAKEWIVALNNLDKYIKEHEAHESPLLREKQYIVYKKIRDFLEQGKRKGYIKLPTGVGKTILFVKIAEALGMRTLVVSPSIIILGQNAKETEKFTDSEFGEYHGKVKNLSGKVTHITYHSLVNAVRDGKINPDDVPVLILDEAHRSLGPERMGVIKKFEGLQLGFTATSEFSEERKVSGLLNEEIFRMDVSEAIREGLICNTQTVHAYTTVDLSGVDINNGKYNEQQLEKVINVLGRNSGAVDLYKTKFSHLKAICNCSGVKHAEDVKKLFIEKGIAAACITAQTPKEERTQILEDYKNGKIKVLTNARVLLEGFNEPSCSVTLNLHPTLSLVDAEQRARSGRLDKNNPEKWSYVVDFIDQNAPKPQVLYSEILGGDRVWDISKTKPIEDVNEIEEIEEKSSVPKPPIDLDDFHIDDIRVVVNAQDIMQVTNRNIIFREKVTERREWTFESLKADVQAKGIKTSKEYQECAPTNNWLSQSALTSKAEFPKNKDGSNDWDTFLSRERRKEITFETLRQDVISKGVKKSSEYARKAAVNKWISINKLVSLPEFPKHPDHSNDWETFLGLEKKMQWTYETLRTDVLTKKVRSSQDYVDRASHNGWPAAKTLTSKNEFPKNRDGSADWSTYLKMKKRKEWTLETLRQDVVLKKIKSSREYGEKTSKNEWFNVKKLISLKEFPKNSDGTADWDTFLGREKKKEWTFKTLQADVRSKGITNSGEYRRKQFENQWISHVTLAFMPEFPKKPDGSNDWDSFLGRKK